MTSYIPEQTKIVTIPNIYFDGYFPQYIRNNRNIDTDKHVSGRFPHGDRFIDEIMENSEMNPNVENILDRICMTDFLSAEKINDAIESSFEELHRREWICDLKIADYVEENFSEQQLFYSPNHPISNVMIEMTRRILNFIGFKSMTFLNLDKILIEQDLNYSLIGQDIPIYPSVLNQLNLKSHAKTYWANIYLWNFHADFRTFSREYILKCWAEKFTR